MTTPARVLVTGAGGFVGRHLVAQLREGGTEVVAVTHRWSDSRDLTEAVGPGPVDWCAHLGWYAAPADYLTSVAGNRDALARSLELIDVLGAVGCGYVVVAGSAAEYGAAAGVLDEDSLIDPWSVYGATKAALRLLLRSSLRPPDLGLGWARLFNVTGPGESPERLLPSLVRALLAGRPFAATSGTQRRDYLDVADVAAAFVAMGRERVIGDVNVCSGEGVPLRRVLEAVAVAAGGDGLVDFGARPAGPHETSDVVGSSRRLRSATGWAPRYDLEAIAARVVDYWRAAA